MADRDIELRKSKTLSSLLNWTFIHFIHYQFISLTALLLMYRDSIIRQNVVQHKPERQ